MSEPWKTVASVESRSQAQDVRDLLESAGLAVLLEDSAGAIHVKVAEQDHPQALAVYQGIQPALPHDAFSAAPIRQPRKTAATGSDEEDEPPDPREKLAERAFRATIFGLVLFPLLPVGFVLWLRALLMRGRLEGWYRRYMYFMGVIFVGPLLLVLLSFKTGFSGEGEVERMDKLTRPAAFIGVWQRTEETDRGQAFHQLFLGGDGAMRYRIFGAGPLAYEGLWGVDRKGLHLYFEVTGNEDRSLLGRTIVWSVVQTADNRLVFHNGREQVVFGRK